MNRRKLLFVSYGGGHAAMIAPVIEAIRSRASTSHECVVLGLTMAGPYFADRGIEALGFRQLLENGDEPALRLGEELASRYHADHTRIVREESIAYLGLCYQELIEQHGLEDAKRRVAENGLLAFLPIKTLRRVLERVQPDIVVTTNAPRAERAARIVAREWGLPTIALTDLLGLGDDHLDVDHLCVASRSAMRAYQKNPGVYTRHYHLTGNPALDRAAGFASSAHLASSFDRPITQRRTHPRVLTAEQGGFVNPSGQWEVWNETIIQKNLNCLFHACRENGAVLLVRPHPSLSLEVYQAWVAEKPPGTAIMANDVDLHPLLASCDVLVSNMSTTMLDMLFMERPVVQLDYPNATSFLPLGSMKMAFHARIDEVDHLSRVLGEALKGRTETFAAQLQTLHGEFPKPPCTPRVCEVIDSILSCRS
jgi:hypothetical protein